ncbi:MAG: hypothetical protein KJ062_17260 [Thermoanaerobaculia bacterium]|nr:hypothetical protein [Thermoanaerobaculia bacterium]
MLRDLGLGVATQDVEDQRDPLLPAQPAKGRPEVRVGGGRRERLVSLKPSPGSALAAPDLVQSEPGPDGLEPTTDTLAPE